MTLLRRWLRFAIGALAVFTMPVAVSAQQVKVTIDLSAGSITTNVPFDEPFTLTGSAGTQVQKLIMTYRETPELCARIREETKKNGDAAAGITSPAPATNAQAGPFSKPQTWERRTGDTFAFVVGPLQPHACYTLRFQQFLQPASNDERKLLRDQLSAMFRTAIVEAGKQGFLAETKRAALLAELQRTANEFVRDKFRAAAPTINLEEAATKESLLALFQRGTNIATAELDIKGVGGNPGRIKGAAKVLCLDPSDPSDPSTCQPNLFAAWTDFRARLATHVADPAALLPGAKTMWTTPLNPTREGQKTVTVAQMAAILSGSTAPAMQAVLEGRAKIAGAVIASANAPDPDSIDLIGDFIQVTSNPAFATAAGPVMPTDLRNEAPTILGELRGLAKSYATIPAENAAIAATQFADVLAGQLLLQEFSVVTEPTIVTADANPYISADVGFGYVFRLDKGYPYYGVNFYRVPVNKRAPLGRFKGSERFWRSASLLVGLSTAAFEDTRTKNFLSAGSPMLGFGYRVNQYVKINAGAIAFKQAPANPVVATLKNKYLPFASISIDLDVRAMLKGAGGFLPQ